MCMKSTPSHICLMNTVQLFSVSTKSSSITLSNSSPPSILKTTFRYAFWVIGNDNFTYNSNITTITFPFSYASYSWINLGCCSCRIISTSLSTFLLSSFFGQLINFAANANPVLFSLHRYTVPNFPLTASRKINTYFLEPSQLAYRVHLPLFERFGSCYFQG